VLSETDTNGPSTLSLTQVAGGTTTADETGNTIAADSTLTSFASSSSTLTQTSNYRSTTSTTTGNAVTGNYPTAPPLDSTLCVVCAFASSAIEDCGRPPLAIP